MFYEDNNPHELLDQWFASDAWKSIVQWADDGDEDSTELMERVNDQLASLIFHLENESDPQRIKYEINYFKKLMKDFDVE